MKKRKQHHLQATGTLRMGASASLTTYPKIRPGFVACHECNAPVREGTYQGAPRCIKCLAPNRGEAKDTIFWSTSGPRPTVYVKAKPTRRQAPPAPTVFLDPHDAYDPKVGQAEDSAQSRRLMAGKAKKGFARVSDSASKGMGGIRQWTTEQSGDASAPLDGETVYVARPYHAISIPDALEVIKGKVQPVGPVTAQQFKAWRLVYVEGRSEENAGSIMGRISKQAISKLIMKAFENASVAHFRPPFRSQPPRK